MMHAPLKKELVALLERALQTDAPPADKLLENLFRAQRRWGSRDRRQVAEVYYEVIRWARRLEVLSGSKHINDWVEYWLKCGVKIEDSSIQLSAAEQESFPDWLYQLGERELGQERWKQVARASNQVAPVDLRVNTLKADVDQVIAGFESEGILVEKISSMEQALTLKERKNIFNTKVFQQGWVEVQDRASQLIAPFLAPEPGERIVDACSGAGGKTLHLATLMKNRGSIVALDVSERKLQALKLRARRAGHHNIETRWIENNKVIKRLNQSADRLLLDVPCSGTGVFRRKPDAKWRIQPEAIDSVKETQREILTSWSEVLKEGGTLVYSTCSVLPSENQEQMNWFLRNNTDYELISQISITPDEGRGDGFFAAKLRKIK